MQEEGPKARDRWIDSSIGRLRIIPLGDPKTIERMKAKFAAEAPARAQRIKEICKNICGD